MPHDQMFAEALTGTIQLFVRFISIWLTFAFAIIGLMLVIVAVREYRERRKMEPGKDRF